ncbi:HAD-superfamily hydrolase [Legionella beliardensis]|uniref:phosphoglycolate phosphatase n=1 Tax=Legionella beliardensis TaxID=91822 RepID=A0A378JSQ7_9GAMM|nr:HAD hydrolase-like protein [Legionella beliardensis]STX55618.1 HAD-superfamily hydrolase [Legionella beliardensis]
MSKNSNPNNIIFFDFDGTIVDTMKQYFHLYNEFANKNNKPIIAINDYQKLRNNSFNEVRKKLGLNLLETFIIAKKIKKQLFKDPYLIKIVPGIIDIINEIHKRNFLIYIVSSNTKNNIQKILIANKINHIEKIISTYRGFNKTYFIKKYLKKNKDYQRAFLVSDEYKDIRVANKLDIISIAVTWGANDFIQNQEVIPNFTISEPGQILTAIKQLE